MSSLVSSQPDVTSDALEKTSIDPDGTIGKLVATGRTLPSSWYSSDQIYRQEQLNIFRRGWEYVGSASSVSRRGDYFTCEVGGVPIVVVRGKDDEVRALVNICRHRHHPVAVGEGNCSVLQCLYHAWTYKLDGRFNAAPRSKTDPSFSGDGLSLAPVAVDNLGDMLFVNVSGDAPPLEDALAPATTLARQRGIAIDSARYQGSRELIFGANWKIAWENNLECYHCPTVHKNWYKTARLGPEYVYVTPISPLHFEYTLDQHEDAQPDYSYHLWPTVYFGSGAFNEPGSNDSGLNRDYLAMRFEPIGPRQTKITAAVYAVEDLSEEVVAQRLQAVIDIVEEDRAVCERVQAAHDSEIGPPGTLVTAVDSEAATVRLERLVYRAVTEPEVPLYNPLDD
ncbi:aromatic ring-hydroxylating dioxygenase subunit alpha [Rhodococcus sp. NPDC057014]|uniref:aromatic ring-hydroxylating oxygenase subunit alpha n=1 Tax=Rhodococcus sp. NPDC057014 TaxID=3346000 RepID=UPI00364232D2